jgi:hypothetical protein
MELCSDERCSTPCLRPERLAGFGLRQPLSEPPGVRECSVHDGLAQAAGEALARDVHAEAAAESFRRPCTGPSGTLARHPDVDDGTGRSFPGHVDPGDEGGGGESLTEGHPLRPVRHLVEGAQGPIIQVSICRHPHRIARMRAAADASDRVAVAVERVRARPQGRFLIPWHWWQKQLPGTIGEPVLAEMQGEYPDGIGREDLRSRAGATATGDAAGLLRLFVATMMWGVGSGDGRGPWRIAQGLRSEGALDTIVATAALVREGDTAGAYRWFSGAETGSSGRAHPDRGARRLPRAARAFLP